MAQRALVVEAVTSLSSGTGVKLFPTFPLDLARSPLPRRLRREPCPVTLLRPDGATFQTVVYVGEAHISPINRCDPHWIAFFWLPNASVSDVPVGTEVWIADEEIMTEQERLEADIAEVKAWYTGEEQGGRLLVGEPLGLDWYHHDTNVK